MPQERVAIVGSCVTRDAFELPGADPWQIGRYMARTGLGSFTGPATAQLEADFTRLDSAFQRRTVRDDVEKTGWAWLNRGMFEVLLYDAIDERFPLLEFPDGGLVTESWEFTRLQADVAAAHRYELFSPEHLARWEAGWQRLLDMMDGKRARHRIRVHAAPWALDVRGSDEPAGDPGEVAAANEWLAARYARMAEDLAPGQVLTVDRGLWLADADHRWGVTPFHYVPEYYANLLAQLAG